MKECISYHATGQMLLRRIATWAVIYKYRLWYIWYSFRVRQCHNPLIYGCQNGPRNSSSKPLENLEKKKKGFFCFPSSFSLFPPSSMPLRENEDGRISSPRSSSPHNDSFFLALISFSILSFSTDHTELFSLHRSRAMHRDPISSPKWSKATAETFLDLHPSITMLPKDLTPNVKTLMTVVSSIFFIWVFFFGRVFGWLTTDSKNLFFLMIKKKKFLKHLW